MSSLPPRGNLTVASTKPFDGPDRGSTPDDGWLAAVDSNTASQESFTVEAVCAESGGYKYVHSERKNLPNNSSRSARATCPAKTDVTGGGVDNTGIDTGAEIESTFPIDGPDSGDRPDNGWEGVANNDHTGHAETVRAFAICLKSETRKFSGTANGGTVTFKAKFEDGKTRALLPRASWLNVPISCDQGATTHSLIEDVPLKVKDNNTFKDRAPQGRQQSAFELTGRFNHDGTEASGTYRDQATSTSRRSTST